jgi:nicotinamidase-related amidase
MTAPGARNDIRSVSSASSDAAGEPVDPGWLVVVDPQVVFADPAVSPWGSPMWADAVPHVVRLASRFGVGRTVVTRFVADPSLGGSWVPYYERWPFALVPDDDPLYAVVPELAGLAGHVVTAGTFGKWPVLRPLIGDDAVVTLSGVAADCCVLSTALAMADAGVTVRVASSACAGSTVEAHERALATMALYAPQVTTI